MVKQSPKVLGEITGIWIITDSTRSAEGHVISTPENAKNLTTINDLMYQSLNIGQNILINAMSLHIDR